jgi:flavin reductase (DIM6/NTAB) family NADH-FMN oxidoreductase RutF
MTPRLRLVTDPAATAPVAEFADAMSALASGVVIVTSRVEGRPWGTTVIAFASVSADPPTVLVSLGSETAAAHAIAASGRFGVSLLAEEQLAVACHGSAPGEPKFLEAFGADAETAAPIVPGALAHLDCEVVGTAQIADHTVFFGYVLEARASQDGQPLLYHRREYRALASRPTGRAVTCLSS